MECIEVVKTPKSRDPQKATADDGVRHHFLREWRKHRNMSLRELARLLPSDGDEPLVSYVSIGRIERGEQPYSQRILEALSQALDVPVTDLLSIDPTDPSATGELLEQIRNLDEDRKQTLLRIAKTL